MAGGSLIQCYDDPLTNATNNGTESFRASLLSLLATLPSAAAPTGFASLRSESGRAFAQCLGCLSVAAWNLTSGYGATTRSAGIWTDLCFVAYADTHASSPAEDAFRSRVLLRGHDAVTDDADAAAYFLLRHAELVALAQHVALSAAANISRARMLGTADAATVVCWRSAPAGTVRRRSAAGACNTRFKRWTGVAAAVVAFNCYLRFEISTSLLPRNAGDVWTFILLGVFVGTFLGVFLFCFLLGRRRINADKKIYGIEG